MIQHSSVIAKEESDLIRMLNLFILHYRVYIVTILIAIVFAFFITKYTIPTYKIASSLLILEDRGARPGTTEEYINNELFGLNQGFQNELYILQSTPVIEQTVKNLDLTVNYFLKQGFQKVDAYKKVPFKILLLKDHIQPVNIPFLLSIKDDKNFTIRVLENDAQFINLYTGQNSRFKQEWSIEFSGKFGKLIEHQDFAFIVELSNNVDIKKNEFIYSFEFYTLSSVTASLKNNLKFNVKDAQATIIEVGLKSSSASKGVDVVNELMDVYSTQNVNRKNHIASVTIEYIEKQIGEISDSLNLAEDNLQQFRSSRELVDVTNQATGISAQYMDLQNQLAEILTKKRYYDYLGEYISGNDDFSKMILPSAMGVQDEIMNNLVNQLITAQTQLSNLIQNRQGKNPLVQRLTIQIENTKKAISDNILAIQKTTDISIDEMNKRINRVRSEISRLPRTQRQLGGIERNYRLSDAIYNYLLEKRAEAKISKASNLPDNIIVEPASIMGIISPNSKKNYFFALSMGVIIPFAFFFFKSILGEKIEPQQKMDNLTTAMIIGKIPHNKRKTANIVFEFPKSSIAEAYRALRTNIEFHFKIFQKKVILVSSSIEGEGKSFNALNIAMSYAQLGKKTLLIDFDLRKNIDYFGKSSKHGLTNYFINHISLHEIIQHSPHSKLDFISSGPIPPNPVEILASNYVSEFFDLVKENYECVIIDSTPLAQVSDAYLLMDYANIKVIVARYNYTIKNIFRMIMKDLNEKEIENVCVLMNDNKVYNDQYGYGYGYEKKKGD